MKIIIAGDYYPDGVVRWDDNIEKLIKNSDYSIVNFESPIISNKDKPIIKNGPNLYSLPDCLIPIKQMGFQCLTLANNHTLDFGSSALIRTINLAKFNGFDFVGASDNLENANEPLIKHINGQSFAIINCCEHEFSIAEHDKPGANPLDPINQYYSIQSVKNAVDNVIVIVHGGHEGYQLPSPRMQQTYRFFIDSGASIVINHHQHCFSGYERYNNGLIFYGLGNFFFLDSSMIDSKWNNGFLLELIFEKGNIDFKLHPYIQCSSNRNIQLINKLAKVQFYDKIQSLNDIITNKEDLRKANLLWRESTQSSYKECLLPVSNKYLSKLWTKNFIPLHVNKTKISKLLNAIECESHRDRFIDYLKSLL